MDALLRGAVRNARLPKDHGLDTVMEAVVNSIQSIHRDGGSKVVVRYLYDTSQTTIDGRKTSLKVRGFEIEDDGVGFNPANLESFDTLNSEAKLDMGCKGVGRVLWLKVFRDVTVDSSFESEDSMHRVSFRFHVGRDKYRDEPSHHFDGPRRTIVRLDGIEKGYYKYLNKQPDTIARHILNHCFSYFVNWEMPDITVESNDGAILVNDLFDERRGNMDEVPVEVRGHGLKLTFFRFYGWKGDGNRVEFCADGRTVKSMPIFKDVRLTDDDDEDFVFCAYVSGDLLDENVNDLRTDFSIQEHRLDPDEVSMDEIVDEVKRQCKGYLGKALSRDEVRRRERIESISKAYPEIGLICRSDPTIVEDINADMSEQELYAYINRRGADMNTAAMFDIKDLIGQRTRIYEGDGCEDIMSRIDDMQRNTLARYVIGRRLVIDMLERGMQRSVEDDKFPLESYIHNIMLPRGTDPDHPSDVNSCNLWLLDERMNYYAYGGAFSDVYMKRITGDDDEDRPDVVVFSEIDEGVTRSVALVEFKRYDRKDYDMEGQIKRYVMKIRKAGSIELESGRKIALTSETTFHCFGVCDLFTGYGDELAVSNYTSVYGGRGYYQWFPKLNASIEFIDYGKVASDAKLRNKVFFDVLGIGDE